MNLLICFSMYIYISYALIIPLIACISYYIILISSSITLINMVLINVSFITSLFYISSYSC